MKILLVGEYSRLHNSLQEGLRALGHQVILISTGDYFKKYPSDIIIQRSFDAGFARKLKIAIYSLEGAKKLLKNVLPINEQVDQRNSLK